MFFMRNQLFAKSAALCRCTEVASYDRDTKGNHFISLCLSPNKRKVWGFFSRCSARLLPKQNKRKLGNCSQCSWCFSAGRSVLTSSRCLTACGLPTRWCKWEHQIHNTTGSVFINAVLPVSRTWIFLLKVCREAASGLCYRIVTLGPRQLIRSLLDQRDEFKVKHLSRGIKILFVLRWKTWLLVPLVLYRKCVCKQKPLQTWEFSFLWTISPVAPSKVSDK